MSFAIYEHIISKQLTKFDINGQFEAICRKRFVCSINKKLIHIEHIPQPPFGGLIISQLLTKLMPINEVIIHTYLQLNYYVHIKSFVLQTIAYEYAIQKHIK